MLIHGLPGEATTSASSNGAGLGGVSKRFSELKVGARALETGACRILRQELGCGVRLI